MDIFKMLEDFKNKDFTQFPEFYEATSKTVYYIIKNIVKDEDDTQDIMQDVYVKFLDNLVKVIPNNPIAYLNMMARNYAINFFNKNKKISNIEEEDSILNDEEKTEDLSYLYEVLTNDEKEVVIYHIVNDMKFKDIAIVINKPLGTVLWLYNKAIKKMKERMNENDQ